MSFVETIKEAGIVGAGGAGFPTYVKLNAKAEYFIINAAECEPLIETDKYLCRTFPERIIRTAVRIAEHLEAEHCVIATKAKYKREIAALQAEIERQNARVEICGMRTFYPAGDEQVIVQEVTGRSVPERGLPLDVGCVVDNVGTVLSIADALEGKPVSEKYLSVTGAVKHTGMYHVPLGTPITQILGDAELAEREYAVLVGGPMMGKMLREEEEIRRAAVTKTTGNLLVLPKDHYLVKRSELPRERMIRQAAAACIQCKMCTDMCPRFMLGHEVRPNVVMRNLWKESMLTDAAEYEKAFGSAVNCCSCGVCEMFACPMGLSPRKMNEYAKGLLREKGINPHKNMHPEAREAIQNRKIPTERLIARLELTPYVTHELPAEKELEVKECRILLSQHIGKPAQAVVHEGEYVEKNDLVAQAAEGLSVNIHTGLAGVVKEVTDTYIRICGEEV